MTYEEIKQKANKNPEKWHIEVFISKATRWCWNEATQKEEPRKSKYTRYILCEQGYGYRRIYNKQYKELKELGIRVIVTDYRDIAVQFIYDTDYHRGVLIDCERVDLPMVVNNEKLERIKERLKKFNIKFEVKIIE